MSCSAPSGRPGTGDAQPPGGLRRARRRTVSRGDRRHPRPRRELPRAPQGHEALSARVQELLDQGPGFVFKPRASRRRTMTWSGSRGVSGRGSTRQGLRDRRCAASAAGERRDGRRPSSGQASRRRRCLADGPRRRQRAHSFDKRIAASNEGTTEQADDAVRRPCGASATISSLVNVPLGRPRPYSRRCSGADGVGLGRRFHNRRRTHRAHITLVGIESTNDCLRTLSPGRPKPRARSCLGTAPLLSQRRLMRLSASRCGTPRRPATWRTRARDRPGQTTTAS